MSTFSYPENPALTNLPLLDPIKRRWSPLAFSNEPLISDMIATLFEAARWTPSLRNEQPWRYIYATHDDKENFDRLVSFLTEDNKYLAEAYLLMLICAFPTFPNYDNKPNRTHQYDTGSATQSLVLQAVSMGLVVHVVGGFDKQRPYTELGIPQDVPLIAMAGIGYPGDESKVDPELLKERYEQHRQRKSLDEFAFKGKWRGK